MYIYIYYNVKDREKIQFSSKPSYDEKQNER